MRMRASGTEPPKPRHISPTTTVRKALYPTLRDKVNANVPHKTLAEASATLGMGTVAVPNYKITSLMGIGFQPELKVRQQIINLTQF
jgi:hypothetical protein